MTNKQYAYVIKRDDGKYFKGWNIRNETVFTDDIINSLSQLNVYTEFKLGGLPKENLEDFIDREELENCKVQKICIMECEEDE